VASAQTPPSITMRLPNQEPARCFSAHSRRARNRSIQSNSSLSHLNACMALRPSELSQKDILADLWSSQVPDNRPRKPLRLSALRSPRKEGEQRGRHFRKSRAQHAAETRDRAKSACTMPFRNRQAIPWVTAAIFPIGRPGQGPGTPQTCCSYAQLVACGRCAKVAPSHIVMILEEASA
jgi:hypothetical protein